MLSSQSHKVTHSYSIGPHPQKTQSCNTHSKGCFVPVHYPTFHRFFNALYLCHPFVLSHLFFMFALFGPLCPYNPYPTPPFLLFSFSLFCTFLPGQQDCHCLLKNLTLSHRYFVHSMCLSRSFDAYES